MVRYSSWMFPASAASRSFVPKTVWYCLQAGHW